MKKFISPEIEITILDLTDVLTASNEATSESTAAAPTGTVPATTVPEVSDAGLDNEISATQWEF